MDEPIYSLQELSDESEVEPRTIRSYIERDLLPGPYGLGPKASYGPEHLARLRVIRLVRDARRNITLDQIRSLLVRLSPEQIAAIAAGEERLDDLDPVLSPSSSALEYLMGLVPRSPVNRVRRPTPRVMSAPRSQEPFRAPEGDEEDDGAPAYEIDFGIEEESEPIEVAAAPRMSVQSPVPPAEASQGRTPFEELLEVLASAVRSEGVTRSVRSETWHRVRITPDVELAVRGELDIDHLALLQRVGDHLRHLLMKGTRK